MGILQARRLDWVARPFSRKFAQPRDRTKVSCIVGRFFSVWAIREAPTFKKSIFQQIFSFYHIPNTASIEDTEVDGQGRLASQAFILAGLDNKQPKTYIKQLQVSYTA